MSSSNDTTPSIEIEIFEEEWHISQVKTQFLEEVLRMYTDLKEYCDETPNLTIKKLNQLLKEFL